jgi:hypothetical protein
MKLNIVKKIKREFKQLGTMIGNLVPGKKVRRIRRRR